MSRVDVLNKLVFDISGKLITSQGDIPTFLRPSIASAEYVINNSLRVVPAKADTPRFSQSGELDLEPQTTNYLTQCLNLNSNTWIKGSSIFVSPDRVVDMIGNYTAERVTVSAFAGNYNAQKLIKPITLGSGRNFVGTVYLKLAGGQFGPNDRIGVDGDVTAASWAYLSGTYNDSTGNYIALSFNFTTAGSEVDPDVDDDEGRLVNFTFHCESSVSVDWGGAQIEEGDIRTSFIPTGSETGSRALDYLQYGRSPMSGLASTVVYSNITAWRGSGRILEAGNLRIEILNGYLKATAGVVDITDPDPLPASARVAIRISKGLEAILIYVDGVLKIRENLSGWAGTSTQLNVGGESFLRLQNLYVFNGDLSDGGVSTGGSVSGSMATLFSEDTLIVDQSPGYSELSFPAIYLPPGWEAEVRLPGIQLANQVISGITPSGSAVAQVTRVWIEIIDNVAAAQTDFFFINETKWTLISDATPTRAEIASGFQALVAGSPKYEPVTASYSGSNEYLTLTADNAGQGFEVNVSDRLGIEHVTANDPGLYVITVPNAVDYSIGRALIFRDNVFIAEVGITAINLVSNQLTVTFDAATSASFVVAGDQVIQRSWELEIGENALFAHHYEDFGDVRISAKRQDRFAIANVGAQPRIVTPYCKITL